MKYIFLVSLVALSLTGCTLGFWGDAVSNHKSDYDQMFADRVKDDINTELKHENPPWDPAYGTSWREFWIESCEEDYYNFGDAYVQYTIDQRRAAGLPDILEIDKRQFKSEWQFFTDNVDRDLNRELHGSPAPSIANTWPDYWKISERSFSSKQIEYLNNRRKQLGLKPLE